VHASRLSAGTSYDANGNLAGEEEVDGAGAPVRQVTYDYDASGRVATVTDLLRGTTAAHQVVEGTGESTTALPLGVVEKRKVDGAGRAQWVHRQVGGAGGQAQAFAHDRDGHLLVAAVGGTVANAQGRIADTSTIAAGTYTGKTRWSRYNAVGQMIQNTNPELTNATPGKFGRTDVLPIGWGLAGGVLDEVGNQRVMKHDEEGVVIQVREDGEYKGPGSPEDAARRETSYINSRKDRTRITIRRGNMRYDDQVAQSSAAVVVRRDSLGRVIEESRYSGQGLVIAGTTSDMVVSALEAAAKPGVDGKAIATKLSTQTVYDSLGRVALIRRPDGTEVSYDYFPDDQASKNDRRQVRALLLKASASASAAQVRVLSEYNRFGQSERLSEFNADGVIVTIRQQYGTVSGPSFGLVVSETTSFIGLPTGETSPADRTVAYAYDAAGKRTSVTYPSGLVMNYAYTDEVYLTKATRSTGEVVFDTTLDSEYRRPITQKRWGSAVTLSYSYAGWENTGLLKSITVKPGTAAEVDLARYGYDVRGLKSGIGQWPDGGKGALTHVLTYDGVGRLQKSDLYPSYALEADRFHEESGQLDAAESRTTQTVDGASINYYAAAADRYKAAVGPVAVFNANGRLPQLSGSGSVSVEFGYGDRGVVTSEVYKAGGLFGGEVARSTYTWDGLNRLREDMSGSSDGYSIVACRYDALGRRVQQVERRRLPGEPTEVKTTRTWVYDGQQMIEEYNAAGNLAQRISNGPGLNQPIAVETWPAGATVPVVSIIISDEQGSVLGVTDAAGAIREKFTYGVTGLAKRLGEPTKTRSAWVPFGWQGMYKDPASARLHTHYRDYDPLHGRWTSEDPMGMMDGWNLYHGYMGPNGTDPEGTVTSWAGAGIGAATGALGYAAFGWMGENGYTRGGWAGAIAGGALTGAVIGSFGVEWSGAAVIGGSMLAAGAGGGVGSVVQQGVDHGSVNWGQVGTDAAFSGATAGLLGGAGVGLKYALTNTGAGRFVGGLMLAGALRYGSMGGSRMLSGGYAALGESAGTLANRAMTRARVMANIGANRAALRASRFDSWSFVYDPLRMPSRPSVLYRARMPKALYPGIKESAHFREANRQLLAEMDASPAMDEATAVRSEVKK
jgi:RHS repeat-associated protein